MSHSVPACHRCSTWFRQVSALYFSSEMLQIKKLRKRSRGTKLFFKQAKKEKEEEEKKKKETIPVVSDWQILCDRLRSSCPGARQPNAWWHRCSPWQTPVYLSSEKRWSKMKNLPQLDNLSVRSKKWPPTLKRTEPLCHLHRLNRACPSHQVTSLQKQSSSGGSGRCRHC